jgi:hypothetical protein
MSYSWMFAYLKDSKKLVHLFSEMWKYKLVLSQSIRLNCWACEHLLGRCSECVFLNHRNTEDSGCNGSQRELILRELTQLHRGDNRALERVGHQNKWQPGLGYGLGLHPGFFPYCVMLAGDFFTFLNSVSKANMGNFCGLTGLWHIHYGQHISSRYFSDFKREIQGFSHNTLGKLVKWQNHSKVPSNILSSNEGVKGLSNAADQS